MTCTIDKPRRRSGGARSMFANAADHAAAKDRERDNLWRIIEAQREQIASLKKRIAESVNKSRGNK